MDRDVPILWRHHHRQSRVLERVLQLACKALPVGTVLERSLDRGQSIPQLEPGASRHEVACSRTRFVHGGGLAVDLDVQSARIALDVPPVPTGLEQETRRVRFGE